MHCNHKGIFPILGFEFLGLFILIVLLTLSTLGGIGGGGAVVPFTMTFFGFTTKEAISISGLTIFFCAVVKFVFHINDKHPEKDAVIIDYGLASIMLPAVMMGSMVGVIANYAFPPLVLQTSLTVLLMFLTYQAGSKCLQIYRKENITFAAIKKKQEQERELKEAKQPLMSAQRDAGLISKG